MKINRVSSEKTAPSWAFEDSAVEAVPRIDAETIEKHLLITHKLDDNAIVGERERLASCADEGKPYYYNASWGDKAVTALREYAIVCGMSNDMMKPVSPSYINDLKVLEEESQQREAQSSKMTKTASTIELSDPFNLAEVEDDRSTAPSKDDWEKIAPEMKLENNTDGRPSMMTNAIKSIKGGESIYENSFTQTARGQNTIGSPDAIKEYEESEEEDSRSRIRRQNKEAQDTRTQDNQEWRDSQASERPELDEDDIVGKGTVFPTESMNANPGLGGPNLEQLDKALIPEMTLGETIASRNEESRGSIQRDKTDNDWEGIQSHSARSISDDFIDSLKKELG